PARTLEAGPHGRIVPRRRSTETDLLMSPGECRVRWVPGRDARSLVHAWLLEVTGRPDPGWLAGASGRWVLRFGRLKSFAGSHAHHSGGAITGAGTVRERRTGRSGRVAKGHTVGVSLAGRAIA